MDKKERDPQKEAALIQISNQCIGTEASSQCARLLMALQQFPVTSFEAMRFLDVYHVPARVLQLRQAGHDIVTHWRTVETEAGAAHRVGLYVLHRGTSPVTA